MVCHIQINKDKTHLKTYQFKVSSLEKDAYDAIGNWSPTILEVSSLYEDVLNITNYSRYKKIVKNYWKDVLNYESNKGNTKF